MTALIAFTALLAPQPQETPKTMQPPVAATKPHVLEKHNHKRIDEYYWLRDRENPDVIQYLKEENAYLDAAMGHTKDLQAALQAEFKARIKQTDTTVPYRKDGYWYYSRTIEGKDYQVICRRKGTMEAPEEVLVDGNKEAEGTKFFSLGVVSVSPSNQLLAWGADTVGRRFYTVRFRDLATGRELPDVLKDITSSLVWANDSKTVFYAKQDPQTLRSYRIYRHTLGADPAQDPLIYEESDVEFSVGLQKTRSKKFVVIRSSQTLANEFRIIDADRPESAPVVFTPRERGHEHEIDHYSGRFYIVTNLKARNFRLMSAPEDKTQHENWTEVLPHRDDTLLAGITIFKDYLLVTERRGALVHLRVRPWSGEGEHYIDFGEPAYAAGLGRNEEDDTGLVRYHYSSLTTPYSVYDYNTRDKTRTLLKRDEVLAGFDQNNYVTERLWAASHDGVQVPVSVVYRKGEPPKNARPLLQYGYGSYGLSSDAYFNPFVISLLDRGFVYAIAHIRGGQEMGRQWYDDGKLMKKKNTFLDFISVTEHLVKNGYADPKRVYAMGGSAGGLLVGAVMNMRPDLYHGIVAMVPFVDVVTTMLDDTIPLTTFEYDEWGNPNEQAAYEYMLSYSPYDQVQKKAYPNLLVTTGLHDSQVQYWEPAKWVARLRARKTDKNLVLMHTNMDAGHGGASARYQHYEEVARIYAFLLDRAGLAANAISVSR